MAAGGRTIDRKKVFHFHKRDLDGNKIGETITYSWEQLKDFYLNKSKDASKHDLNTSKGYQQFRRNAEKALNRELSPEYSNRKDLESKGRVPQGERRLRQAQYDANRAAQRKAEREAAAAARSALIASYTFKPLSDEDIHKIANKKAIDAISGQKQRALLYKIAPEPVPESYIPYRDYARLQRRGFNVPPILGTAYRGNFSPDSTSAMRKTVYDYVRSYLKGGGNPNFIDKELGHLISMSGVDEFGTRYSGLTVPPNVEMQDVRSNRSQHNKVTQELLRRLGYHTDTSLMNLKGADSRVSPRGRLPRLAGRYALPAGVLGLAAGTTQASDLPWLAADFATGVDSEKFIRGMQDRQMQRHGQSYGDYARGSRVGQAASGILDFLTNEENEYRQKLMRNVDRFL